MIISIGLNDAGEPKDTANNIRASGEFVINLVTEELFGAMNLSAADFPTDQSELDIAHLHTAPSVHIGAPRVAEAQVSLECKLHSAQPLGANTLIIGEVVMFHVTDALLGRACISLVLHLSGGSALPPFIAARRIGLTFHASAMQNCRRTIHD